MLPPNTTAHLQLQEAGVIRALKDNNIALKNQHVVEHLDELLDRAQELNDEEVQHESKRLFNADVLTTIQWAREAWESVTSEAIANCWKYTAILVDECDTLVDDMERVSLGQSQRNTCTCALSSMASQAYACYKFLNYFIAVSSVLLRSLIFKNRCFDRTDERSAVLVQLVYTLVVIINNTNYKCLHSTVPCYGG